MNRFPAIATAWTALLVAGFAVVLLLGAPVATSADELQTALHPAPPVSQAVAEQSAATIVKLQYPSFAAKPYTVHKATDFGIEHWVIEYSDTSGSAPRGVRISIVVKNGNVEITAFP
jgi:hypothetical protein